MLECPHHGLDLSHDHLLVQITADNSGQFAEVEWLDPYGPLLVEVGEYPNLPLGSEYPGGDGHALDEVFGEEEHGFVLDVVLQQTESAQLFDDYGRIVSEGPHDVVS